MPYKNCLSKKDLSTIPWWFLSNVSLLSDKLTNETSRSFSSGPTSLLPPVFMNRTSPSQTDHNLRRATEVWKKKIMSNALSFVFQWLPCMYHWSL